MTEIKETKNHFVLGLLTGALSGSVIALLFAPKSGRKLRRDINRKTGELIDNTEEYMIKAKYKASDIISEGKKKAEQIIADAKKKTESFKHNH